MWPHIWRKSPGSCPDERNSRWLCEPDKARDIEDFYSIGYTEYIDIELTLLSKGYAECMQPVDTSAVAGK